LLTLLKFEAQKVDLYNPAVFNLKDSESKKTTPTNSLLLLFETFQTVIPWYSWYYNIHTISISRGHQPNQSNFMEVLAN
jgi:hypothetical protein